ncbi:MAG: DUF4160 domain-containing protein [bacterium]
MPTIIQIKGYRLFFVSFDGSEPIHVHVRRGDFSAKMWLSPLRVAWSEFRPHENRELLHLVKENESRIREKWHDHFA